MTIEIERKEKKETIQNKLNEKKDNIEKIYKN